MNLENIFSRAFYDAEMQDKFFYELLLNDVYAIASSDSETGDVEAGENLRLFSIRNEDSVYIPMFLSMQSLETFLEGNDTPFVKVKACDLLETLKENNIVINPGQEESIVLLSEEIKDLLIHSRN